MARETFTHKEVLFRIVNPAPKFRNIEPGMWIRLSSMGSLDLVGEVTDKEPNFGGIVVAIDGDHSRVEEQIESDGHFEIVKKVDRSDTGPENEVNDETRNRGLDPPPYEAPPRWPSLETSDRGPPLGGRQERASGRGSTNIVVCFDGTRNENETENTNVHRIFNLQDKRYSISHYYSGVGVGARKFSRVLDELTGRGLFRTVRAAYTFVHGNFLEGDRIFIFGFSRGAYAARHLAGMIARMGTWNPVEATYDEYRRRLSSAASAKRKSQKYDVHFLGLFDCVPGNQYYLRDEALHPLNNPVLEPNIRNAAHAVSRDERRRSFRPLLFTPTEQDSFKQVWLPGYHFDVGGDDNEPLNNFALWWMLGEACAHGLIISELPTGVIDPRAPGRCSDWRTTRLGATCVRKSIPNIDTLVGPEPIFPRP
jgi:hypothetical protein